MALCLNLELQDCKFYGLRFKSLSGVFSAIRERGSLHRVAIWSELLILALAKT